MAALWGFPSGGQNEAMLGLDDLAPGVPDPIDYRTVLNGSWSVGLKARPHPALGPRAWRRVRSCWIGMVGDVLSDRTDPAEILITACNGQDAAALASLDGIWAAAVVDEERRRLHLATDTRGQFPMLVSEGPRGLVFSTHPALFARLRPGTAFDPRWFHDVLYFNFPLGDLTFLSGVRRLPPATLLTCELDTGRVDLRTYRPLLGRAPSLAGGRAGLVSAAEVLVQAVSRQLDVPGPRYFPLTSGWDTRTLLAVAGQRADILYSYGTPKAKDLRVAETIAAELGRPHLAIRFDRSFEDSLPEAVLETVWASGGLENPSRSTLLHVYRILAAQVPPPTVVFSGIAMGSVLRGHAQVPSLVSEGVAERLRGRSGLPDGEPWASLLRDPQAFASHVRERLRWLEETYGEARDPEHHLRYVLYEVARKYFGGELALASQYITLRVPVWDRSILEWAFRSAHSMLGYSEFDPRNRRGSYAEQRLQARVIVASGAEVLATTPIRGVTPRGVAGGRMAYLADKVRLALGSKFRVRDGTPLEAWQIWYQGTLRPLMERLLLAPDSRIAPLLAPRALEKALPKLPVQLSKKLLHAEIVARFAENGWRRLGTGDLA